jgi:uncharacterized membrane protein YagU involved in acid resistance
MTSMPSRSAWKGAAAGLAAGVVASLAMNEFQALVSSLSSSDQQGEPATQKAADRLSATATGAPVQVSRKPAAGQAVHYSLGAALGLAYGVAAEAEPAVTSGGGTLFGVGVAVLLDEAVVPAVGLGEAPWRTPLSTHAYTLASHLVFGGAAELTRRLARRALG